MISHQGCFSEGSDTKMQGMTLVWLPLLVGSALHVVSTYRPSPLGPPKPPIWTKKPPIWPRTTKRPIWPPKPPIWTRKPPIWPRTTKRPIWPPKPPIWTRKPPIWPRTTKRPIGPPQICPGKPPYRPRRAACPILSCLEWQFLHTTSDLKELAINRKAKFVDRHSGISDQRPASLNSGVIGCDNYLDIFAQGPTVQDVTTNTFYNLVYIPADCTDNNMEFSQLGYNGGCTKTLCCQTCNPPSISGKCNRQTFGIPYLVKHQDNTIEVVYVQRYLYCDCENIPAE